MMQLPEQQANTGDDEPIISGLSETSRSVLIGTEEDDRLIVMLDAGETFINGKGGDDRIYGGDADDTVIGGAGNDFITGAGGNDNIAGFEGSDMIYGGSGDDFVNGDEGDDLLCGETGNDWIHGGPGDDIISGGAGDDRMVGGDGDDTFLLRPGDGADTIFARMRPGQELVTDADVLQFIGIRSNALVSVRMSANQDGMNDLVIRYGDNDEVVIQDQERGHHIAIDRFQFDGMKRLSHDALLAMYGGENGTLSASHNASSAQALMMPATDEQASLTHAAASSVM